MLAERRVYQDAGNEDDDENGADNDKNSFHEPSSLSVFASGAWGEHTPSLATGDYNTMRWITLLLTGRDDH